MAARQAGGGLWPAAADAGHEGGFVPVRLQTPSVGNPSHPVRLGLRALASFPSEIRRRLYAWHSPGHRFEIRETVDRDGVLRVALIGKLDIAVADAVEQRLRQHREDGRSVRLDLSQLDFIDSSGVQTLVLGLKHARRSSHALEVDRHVSASVERLVGMMGIGSQLRPAGGTG